jgi:FdrA protein
MSTRVKVYPDTYLDSVLQLSGTRSMFEVEGVEWAAAAMATPANVETLLGQGFDQPELGST